jgi:hypothetical protein
VITFLMSPVQDVKCWRVSLATLSFAPQLISPNNHGMNCSLTQVTFYCLMEISLCDIDVRILLPYNIHTAVISGEIKVPGISNALIY